MNKYFDWIQHNLTHNLLLQENELAKSIVALHLLSSELSLSGASVYLERDSSNYLPDVRRCFEKYSLQAGIEWIDSLQKVYGMPIHSDLDSRIVYIMDSEEVQERLDDFNVRSVIAMQTLLPNVDRLLDELVEKIL